MAGYGRALLRDATMPQSPSALGGSTVISNLPEYQRRLSETWADTRQLHRSRQRRCRPRAGAVTSSAQAISRPTPSLVVHLRPAIDQHVLLAEPFVGLGKATQA